MNLGKAWTNLRRHFLPDVAHMLSGRPANSYDVATIESFLGHIGQYFGAHYDASNTGRLNADWSTAYDTPTNNYRAARETIIARTMRMVENNPTAKAILETIVADTVGVGIKPQPRVKFKDGAMVTGLNKALADGWERYNDEYDATGQGTFYELQQTVLSETITCGGVLVNKVRSESGNHIGVASQLVPVLRMDLSHDYGTPDLGSDPNVKQTVFGINLNANGRPVSYYLQGIDAPISAEYMHQVYKRRRPEEYTGVPWFVAALKYLWANEELTKDKLIASRIQAMIGMVMPSKMWSTLAANNSNSDNQLEMKSGHIYHYDASNGNAKPEILQADDSIQNVLIPLQELLLHAISVSMGWSYQTVTRDVSKINMAAGKINTNKDRQAAALIQRWLSKGYCQREWEYFVYRMFLEGKIPGKSIVDYRENKWTYTQCQWRAPGWELIDPYRESQAIALLRDKGLMTLEEYYGDKGVDWRDAINQLADEQAYMKEKGVRLVAASQAAVGIGQKQGAASDDGENTDDADNNR